MADLPIVDTYTTQNFDPTFDWQVGFGDLGSSNQNLQFRVTVRPLHGFEQFTRIPNDTVVFEETGLFLNSIDNLGFWEFSLDKNIASSGGPYRNYQVVVEAHDANGNTSAGNRVGTSNENGWPAYPGGYDIVALYNPRPSGIELTNSVPTQLSGIGPYISITGNHSTKQYLDSNGNITIQFITGALDSDLVGGFIYTSTQAFPKTEVLNRQNFYGANVQRTRFAFNPNNPYIHIPAAAFDIRGAPFVYCSVSFYDEIDSVLLDEGTDTSSGLYLSNNAILYNDAAAGSYTIGGVATLMAIQTTGYPTVARASGLIGSGNIEIARSSTSGILDKNGNITTIFYMSIPLTGLNYTGMGGGATSPTQGGVGGQALYNYTGNVAGGFSGNTNIMVGDDTFGGGFVQFRAISGLKIGDTVVSVTIAGTPDTNTINFDYNADNWRQARLSAFPITTTSSVTSGVITKINARPVSSYQKITYTGANLRTGILYLDSRQVFLRVQRGTGIFNDQTGYSFRRLIDMETGCGIGTYKSSIIDEFISGIETIVSPNIMYDIEVMPYRTFIISGNFNSAGNNPNANSYVAHNSIYNAQSIYNY